MFIPVAQLEANFLSVYYFSVLTPVLLKLGAATLVAFCICDFKQPIKASPAESVLMPPSSLLSAPTASTLPRLGDQLRHSDMLTSEQIPRNDQCNDLRLHKNPKLIKNIHIKNPNRSNELSII